jgi:hypothetical protein
MKSIAIISLLVVDDLFQSAGVPLVESLEIIRM